MSLPRIALWNLAGTAIPIVAGLALIPFTLNRLGSEAFGVLTLVWGLIGNFSVFDLGVGRVLTVQLSRLAATGQDADAGALVHWHRRRTAIVVDDAVPKVSATGTEVAESVECANQTSSHLT